MQVFALIVLFAIFPVLAQATTANPQAPASPSPPSAAPAPQSQTIIIPAGTHIPMLLASPIQAKAARPGASVRAITGFPVTVGSQLAIPAGTYAEGVIDKVVKGGRTGPTLRMHFTRILYANGYSLAIDGANVMAQIKTSAGITECGALTGDSGDSKALVAQSTLPPLPHTGPSVGTMAGIGIGLAAAGIVATVLYMHHLGGGGAALVFDTGWQFEMVLQSPLRVDAATAAAASSGGR